MAKLQKMSICGLRSFGPDDQETVTFSSPLTLFLGQNGCGKTTIIESLKFALTGELPGGSKSGQGFVNDPKISNKQSTKGTVKVKLVDVKGNQLVICRFVQVTQKPGGLTFKNLAPTVRQHARDDPDNPVDISGRCLDIDTYCSQALNVSPAILNNVILCHQENSSWPLDEALKLKGKFDEIFDASKYNKASDTLRKLAKEKEGEIKTMIVELSYKKQTKENVDQMRQRMQDRLEKLNYFNGKIEEKEKLRDPLEKRLNEILELEDILSTLQSQLTGKQEAKKGIIDQQTTIKKNIPTIFQGSDQELTEKIDTFQQEQAENQQLIKKLETRKLDLDVKCKEVSANMQKVQVKMGQLTEEKRQFENRCMERKDLINKAQVKLNLQSFRDCDNQEDSQIILQELKAAFQLMEVTYSDLILQKEAEEKELQITVDKKREKFIINNQSITSKNIIIDEGTEKISAFDRKIKNLKLLDKQVESIDSKLNEIYETLKKLNEKFNEPEIVQKIEEYTHKIQGDELNLEKLEKEHKILQKNYVTEEKIEVESETILLRQSQIMEIKHKHSQTFHDLFGNNIPDKNFKQAVMNILNQEEVEVRNLTNKINRTQREATTTEAAIKHQKDTIKSLENDLKNKQAKILGATKGRPFYEVLNESYVKKEKYQKDKGQYNSAKVMYEAFIEKLAKEACCPVCQTNFVERKNQVKEIINQLKIQIENIPQQLSRVEKELKQEEEIYNKLQQLRSSNDEIEILSSVKLPNTNEVLSEYEKKFKDVSMQLNNSKKEIESHQKITENCRKVLTDATLCDQYLLDINRSQTTVEDLKTEIVTVKSNRSRQETQAEIDTLKAALKDLKGKCESQKTLLEDHRQRCRELLADKQKLSDTLSTFNLNLKERPMLEKQKSELNEQLHNLKAEVEKLKTAKLNLNSDLQDAVKNKDEVVQNNNKIKREENLKIHANKKIIDDIQRVQQSINEYLEKNDEDLLKNAVEELKDLNCVEANLSTAIYKVLDAIASKQQEVAKQALNFRHLQDNLSLREKQKQENQLEEEITQLKKQIGNQNYKSVYNEKQQILTQREAITQKINSIQGQKHEIAAIIKELEKDLLKPEHKNAHKEYTKKFQEQRVASIITKDLWSYTMALETAILKFHRERMVQINKTIRDLWRNIYRGNDIDYIEIQTEMSQSTKARRSYNYKVVQVKKGVELEMRGRCSAGQKVLACLVIRMALAETFSGHCGILALDEPTTNLDRENIISLSEALSRIISSRQHEKNFQIMIITHDEDFLQTLTRVQSVPHYWRVKRNEEGFSVIEKKFL